MKKNFLDNAVSPVIAIMLMLVVCLIIAAVVSGFAGSLVSTQSKTPQALITGDFSIKDGFTIHHSGGDSLAVKDIMITVKNSKLFGPGTEQITTQIVKKTNISPSTDATKFWEYADGSSDVTSFNSGDTAKISVANSSCDCLQPIIAPHDNANGSFSATPPVYAGSKALWNMCFRNTNSIGKTFILEVSDKSTGKMISQSDVIIKG